MLFRAGGDPQETAAGTLTLDVVRTELGRFVDIALGPGGPLS